LQEYFVAKIFGDAKPWQIAVIAIGALGAIGGVTYVILHDEPVDLKHEVTLADVSTGELYTVSTKKRPVIIPEVSPTSGKQTLVRVQKDPQGKWKPLRQDLASLAEDADRSAIDQNSDELKAKGEPKPLTLK
jgi:hypothetical protein